MCGIIGYTGTEKVVPILLAGLQALEYRGYDSAGLYAPAVGVVKSVGKVEVLRQKCRPHEASSATSGLAHTRWATHGEPSEHNAHPHTDTSGLIHIVHNGIIENWRELKDGLAAQGVTCVSATDTEVLAKLIGVQVGATLADRVAAALRLVRGTYGLVAQSETEPATLVTARMGSPLIIGVGEGVRYVASDAVALLPYTRTFVYLEDGDMAVLTPGSHVIVNHGGQRLARPVETAAFDVTVAQKDGYAHFMEKEIFEAPTVITNTTQGRLMVADGQVKLGGLEAVLPQIAQLSRLLIVGCGSAYYAGQVGRLMLEEYTGIPVEVELGSEYRYKRHVATAGTGVLAVTQSGETADTLASIKAAKERGLLTLGIVNVVGSSIARETVAGVYNHAGPEVAVASTKAFLSQLTALAMITVLVGRQRGTLSAADAALIVEGLATLPAAVAITLEQAPIVAAIAHKYQQAEHCMFIGRKFHAPIAYEGALKLKEVTYIHAEAYAAGELKHGSIALLQPDFPVVALAPVDDVYEKMMSNVEEVRARRAPVILVTTADNRAAHTVTDDVIMIPKVHPLLQPILTTIPLQLLAYYIGVAKGLDVDKPRNLAKSVTVE